MKNKIIIFFLSSFIFGEIDYQTQIQPIFDNNCSGYCHVNGGSYQGNLDLSSYENLMAGDSYNGPVITQGDASNSVLIQKIMGTSNFGSRMPQNNPTYFDEHEEELQLIIDWINEGANEIPLEISNKSTQVPTKIKLFENYPNPFNPSTTLVWNQNQLDNLNLSVYTLPGQLVEHISLGEFGIGYHQFLWKPKNISSGIYILTLRGDNFYASNKIIYSK